MYNTGWGWWSRTWIDFELNVHTYYSALQTILPNPSCPSRLEQAADSGMPKINFNPTQVCDATATTSPTLYTFQNKSPNWELARCHQITIWYWYWATKQKILSDVLPLIQVPSPTGARRLGPWSTAGFATSPSTSSSWSARLSSGLTRRP